MSPQIRPVFSFVAITFLLSWGWEGWLLARGGAAAYGLLGLLALMWIPGAVALGFNLRQGRDLGWKRPPARDLLLAFLVPFTFALATGLGCHILQVRYFQLPEAGRAAPLLVSALVMFGIGLFGALGEELGWRGFLAARMREAGVKRLNLWLGLVWAAWHLPLVAFGGYYENLPAWQVVPLYVGSILGLNVFLTSLFLRSGSVLVAWAVHTFHNFFFQFFFPALVFTVPGEQRRLFEAVGGDSGLLPVALYGLLALFLHWRNSKRATAVL